MLLGIVVYGAGSFLCYIANSIEVLLVSRFIQAFGASVGSVVTQTILRESVEGHKRHVMFAQISAVIAFTPAIGPLIGGFLDQMFGFKIVFLSLVVMSIGIFLYTFFSLPETKTDSVTNKINVFSVFKKLITNPKVVTYGLLIEEQMVFYLAIMQKPRLSLLNTFSYRLVCTGFRNCCCVCFYYWGESFKTIACHV